MKISKKYIKIADSYLYFAGKNYVSYDYSYEALERMYMFETFGKPRVKFNEVQENGRYNAYSVGKHWMDVTIAMWREDLIKGDLIKFELLDDPEIPEFVKNIVRKLPTE